jgi:hypothetical protein
LEDDLGGPLTDLERLLVGSLVVAFERTQGRKVVDIHEARRRIR